MDNNSVYKEELASEITKLEHRNGELTQMMAASETEPEAVKVLCTTAQRLSCRCTPRISICDGWPRGGPHRELVVVRSALGGDFRAAHMVRHRAIS